MDIQKIKGITKTVSLDLAMALLATFSALSYTFFVFPNQFAPTGINGIATIVQKISGFQLSYLSLLVNIPLCVSAFWRLNGTFARRTFIYVLSFSAALMVIDEIDAIQDFVYREEYSQLLGPITGGIISGSIYGLTIRLGGSTGGFDVVGALLHSFKPRYSTVWMIFTLNMGVAITSYFVFDFKIEPVLLCILYSYMSSTVGDSILRGSKSATKFEIITTHAEEISQEIIMQMHHSCTMLAGQGAYTHVDKTVLICIIHKDQVHMMKSILQKYPDTFAYITQVSETVGKFLSKKDFVKFMQEEQSRKEILK